MNTSHHISHTFLLSLIGVAVVVAMIPLSTRAQTQQDIYENSGNGYTNSPFGSGLPGVCVNPGNQQNGFVPLACYDNTKLSNLYSSAGFPAYLNSLFTFAILIGGMLAVLRLAWAGYTYMTSDLWSNKEHAKEIIRETLLGLVLLLAIYLILQQINPDLLNLNPTRSVPSTAAGSGSATSLTSAGTDGCPTGSAKDPLSSLCLPIGQYSQ